MSLTRDLRDGWRSLARQPSFTLTAVVMLALGIGASSAIFTVVQAVVLKQPFEDPQRIVSIRGARRTSGEFRPVSWDQYRRWIDAPGPFEAVGAFALASPIGTIGGRVERLSAEVVSRRLFDVLGVGPALGRVFLADEDRPGGPAAVVLSHHFWRSAFNGDPEVIGTPLALDGALATVVGVMPEGFDGPRSRARVDVWLPLGASQTEGPAAIAVYARLAEGVSLEAARSRLDAARRGVEGVDDWRVDLRALLDDPLYAEPVSQMRILAAAVALLLLMACVNVASLLVGRNLSRRREIAVRLALGAARRDVVSQLVVESLMLSVAAGGLGLVVAGWAVAGIVPLVPPGVPRVSQMRVDPGVVAFAALAAVVTGLAVSLWPAVTASRTALTAGMKSGDRGSSARSRRARTALVIAEAALAMVVLAAAALMIRSFVRLNPSAPGFTLDDRLSFQLRLDAPRYADEDSRRDAVAQIAERLRGLAGVRSVTAATSLPLTGVSVVFPMRIAGAPPDPGRPPTIHHRAVLPGFLSNLGVTILSGRDLEDRDRAGGEPVAIVNEAFVRRLLPGREPVGVEVEVDEDNGRVVRRIVGVARDARIFGSDVRPRPEIYVPYAQAPFRLVYFVVQAAGPGVNLEPQVRAALREFDRGLPPDRVESLRAIAAASVEAPRFMAVLLGAFATLALLLACLGLYAVAAWSVAQQTREIGTRMALGARPADIRRMVLRYGGGVGLAGAAIGSACALASARALDGWLYGMPAQQPLLVAGLALTFQLLVLAACYVPARRAMRIDPIAALRVE